MPQSSPRIVTSEAQSQYKQTLTLPIGQFNLFTSELEPLPVAVAALLRQIHEKGRSWTLSGYRASGEGSESSARQGRGRAGELHRRSARLLNGYRGAGWQALLGGSAHDHRPAGRVLRSGAPRSDGCGQFLAQLWLWDLVFPGVGAVLNAGLEPFAGFLHVDRPGKPSLVLDLVEEFHQPVVDRAVIAHLNLGEEVKLVQGMLETGTRKALVERVMERLLATETYQGKRYQVRSILQMQARRLASFLRGERVYKAFSFKW